MHEAKQCKKKQNAQTGLAKVPLVKKAFGQSKKRHEGKKQTYEATFGGNGQRLVVGLSRVFLHIGRHVVRGECRRPEIACTNANERRSIDGTPA
jgi:hypothetical protein